MKNSYLLQNEISMQEYQGLLLKIATAFGFTNQQSQYFLQEVYANADNYYTKHQVKECSVRMNLSKLMVYKCIFKISEHFFSQNNNETSSTLRSGIITVFKNFSWLKLQQIPLSYRAVYLLKNLNEFSEKEIAELLNITLIKVKERINKANYLMGNLHNSL
jgi:hypothetical protein